MVSTDGGPLALPTTSKDSSLKAARRMGDDAFQRAPSQDPVSFPDMPPNKKKPPAECKDRCGEVGKEVGLVRPYLDQCSSTHWGHRAFSEN